MHPTNCLNCGTLLTADDNYCPTCGQKTDIHRISFSHIFHEFFHTLTHAGKGVLALLQDLAGKPGRVAAEYIAGKRKKYFNPFTFFMLCIAFFLVANSVFKSVGQAKEPDQRVIAQLPTEKQKKKYINLIDRTNQASEIFRNHSNMVSMMALPFYAFISWLFFMRRRYNYAEFLVANMLFIGFANILMTLLIIPWIGRTAGQPLYFYGIGLAVLIQVLYIGWAQYQFLGFRNRSSIIVTWLVSLLTFFLWSLLIILALFYYVFRSTTGAVIKVMWEKLFG